MLDLFLSLLTGLLLVITLLSKIPIHQWWARAGEFPRMQIAILAVLTTVGWLFSNAAWRWPAVIACLVILGIQLHRILPWTRLWPIQVQSAHAGHDERCITLLIANVLTPNRNAKKLIAQIHHQQPDVVLTLESDSWWQQQLDAALEQEWPYTLKVPLDNFYGMHLYSRLMLEGSEVKWLIQDDIPSIHTWLRFDNGSRIRLYALHPRPPAPNASEESLWRDAELLLVGREIHRTNVPTLVAGDLNDVSWSRTTRLFCRVSGMLDPRRGRGMFSTFHAQYPLLRWPLDHIFTSEHFTLKHMQRLDTFGSDHFPVLASLCFRPSRADEHDAPEADTNDRHDAHDTIDEAKSRDQQTRLLTPECRPG